MTKKPVRRGRKPIPEKDRKDALVQTRVPDELSQTLREAAKKNRVTVSQLIRNVLEDTFDLVDNVVSEAVSLGQTAKRDALKIAETAKGRGGKRSSPETIVALDSVDAWQAVKLNRDAQCARCGRLMTRGESALFGIGDDAHKVWLCLSCGSQL
jgi:RNase P subunit RPR2